MKVAVPNIAINLTGILRRFLQFWPANVAVPNIAINLAGNFARKYGVLLRVLLQPASPLACFCRAVDEVVVVVQITAASCSHFYMSRT